jgi:hypothetical protein
MEAAKQEALNKYKSDSEAWVQKLINEKKLAEQVLDAVGQVARDSKNLISIADASPEVAKQILDKYYWGKTIEEYKESIGYEEDASQSNEKLIEKKANSIYSENKIKDEKKAFISKLWLDGEELEAFNAEFEERTQLKSFNIDRLDEHLTKAYKLATGYSEDKIKEIQKSKAIASAGSIAGWDRTTEQAKSKMRSEVDELLNGRI